MITNYTLHRDERKFNWILDPLFILKDELMKGKKFQTEKIFKKILEEEKRVFDKIIIKK